MKIDWKSKLSSRKFWVAIIGFVTSILFAFNVAEGDVQKVTGIITAMSTLVIYLLVEGNIDSSREENYKLIDIQVEEKKVK